MKQCGIQIVAQVLLEMYGYWSLRRGGSWAFSRYIELGTRAVYIIVAANIRSPPIFLIEPTDVGINWRNDAVGHKSFQQVVGDGRV